MPYFVVLFVIIVPITFAPYIFTADTMTINGVVREPHPLERIAFALIFLGIPALIFYFDIIRPIKKIERTLKEKLKLRRQPVDGSNT